MSLSFGVIDSTNLGAGLANSAIERLWAIIAPVPFVLKDVANAVGA